MKIEHNHIDELSVFLKDITISNVKDIFGINIDLKYKKSIDGSDIITYEVIYNGDKLYNIWNQYNSPMLKNSILKSITLLFGQIDNLNIDVSLFVATKIYFKILILPRHIVLKKKLDTLIG